MFTMFSLHKEQANIFIYYPITNNRGVRFAGSVQQCERRKTEKSINLRKDNRKKETLLFEVSSKEPFRGGSNDISHFL